MACYAGWGGGNMWQHHTSQRTKMDVGCILAMLLGQLRIQPVQACWTEAMRKLHCGMLLDISFDGFPSAMVIADVFARGAHGQQAAELLDGCQRSRQVTVEGLLARQLCLYIPKSHSNEHERQ